MAAFKCPRFEIELPDRAAERSQYAFVLPAEGEFKPSVVVSWRELPAGVTPEAFLAASIEQTGRKLKHFRMLERPSTLTRPDRTQTVFEWGAGQRKFRQIQVFRWVGRRMYVLTGTAREDEFRAIRPQLSKVIASFEPAAAESRVAG